MAITKAFDTSRHNHPITAQYPKGAPIDFAAAYADGYRIWSGRASVGDYYIDPWFPADFDAARAAGFICVPYHVIAPERPDDRQVAKFREALDGRRPDGIVIDLELSRDQTARRITSSLDYHAAKFREYYPESHKRVLLYTNASFANQYVNLSFGLPLFVSNPGPAGSMNTKPSPYLPRQYIDYIAWQKDWKHTIPGVPDPTTDYSEFKMSEAEAREYFRMNDGQEEEDEMSEILEKLDQILSNQDTILTILNAGEVPTPPTPPAPPDDPDYLVLITVEKSNARFAKSKNVNGAPIMQIYPSDNSLVKDRVQFFNGQRVGVFPGKVRADGGEYYYLLTEHIGDGGEALYLRVDDCIKTW